MRPRRPGTKTGIAAALAAALVATGCGARAAPSALAEAAPRSRALRLEAFVNDRTSGLIAAFEQDADGRFSATRSELSEIGLRAPGAGPPSETIRLDTIDGLAYVYDEPNQIIRITAPASARETRDYGEVRTPEATEARRGTGALVNYGLFAAAARQSGRSAAYQGASATLDGRLFSKFGTLSASGVLGHTVAARSQALRLDTTWVYSDPQDMRSYRAGDFVSSGLAWTRPVRLGGAQVQRNFALRPDLVTLPTPVISGSAAAPSALDVYVNNIRTFSQNVSEGPFRVSNLPIVGSGEAKVVLHDAAGRDIEQTVPFYTTPLLLRPGLTDYSFEVGLPRNFYGTGSDSYARTPVAAASARRGLTDWLTAEAHGEGATRLANAGFGFDARLLDRGVASAALSASRSGARTGLQVYGALETRAWGATFALSTQRTIGRYEDLASVTAADLPRTIGAALASGAAAASLAGLSSARAPKAIDRATIGVPVPFDKTSLSLAASRIVNGDGSRALVASASLSRSGPYGSSLFATAFVNLAGARNAGLFAGVSAPLGPTMTASVGLTSTGGKLAATTDISRRLDREPGSYGWRVRDAEGRGGTTSRSAQGAYRSPWGGVEATLAQEQRSVRGSLQATGSAAAIGGDMFLGARIDDAFAVVDARAPGIEVMQDNRPVGRTGASGKLIVPDLRSFQRNTLSIDAGGLPLDADAGQTQAVVAPADRGVALVDFGVKTNVRGATVVLVGADGKPLPVGSRGTSAGGAFVVGYEGRAYLTGLDAHNEARVTLGATECAAAFDYAPTPGAARTIGPVTCR